MKEALTRWDIKAKIGKAGLKGYEVASHMNLTESAFSKRLREGNVDKLAEINAAVDDLIQSKAS